MEVFDETFSISFNVVFVSLSISDELEYIPQFMNVNIIVNISTQSEVINARDSLLLHSFENLIGVFRFLFLTIVFPHSLHILMI